MNPANPPLIRELSALPLLFLNPSLPLDSKAWEENEASVFGKEFFYKYNDNSDQLVLWARIPIAMLSFILGFLVFLWSKRLYGNSGGILSLSLYSFSPNIVAFAGLSTTDLGAALFIFASLFCFYLYTKKQSFSLLAGTGVLLGFALASKYVSIFLIPIFVFLAIIRIGFRKSFVILSYIFLIGAIVLYGSYFFETKPLIKNAPDIREKIEYIKDFVGKFQLDKIGLDKEKALYMAQKVPVPLSAYTVGLLGVMNQSSQGWKSFLLGKYSEKGFWNYFLVAFMSKSTLPTIVCLFFSTILLIKRRKYSIIDELFLIVPIVLFFIIVSRGKVQVGIRHLLQIYPFIFVFIGGILCAPIRDGLKYFFIFVISCLQILSLMTAFPYPISYFNELCGGPDNGYKILRDSNVDWGHGLKALKDYMARNNIDKVKLLYFGSADPAYYNIQFDALKKTEFKIPEKGIYAISANYIDWVEWARKKRPDCIVSHSILIYKH